MSMVLLCGIPTESPLALVRDRLEELRVPHLVLSQRSFERAPIRFEVRDGRLSGSLTLDGREHPLDGFRSVYTRLMDDQHLPELAAEPPGSIRRRHSQAWHETLGRWCEIAPILVVNRVAAMASNCSKPLQAQTISRHGFLVPDTLVTSDPRLVREFLREHGRVIFKSTSGVRSIVHLVDDDALARLDSIRWCPVQFQEYVPGRNVRVHTVGPDVFATAISTEATDYRYAGHESGEPATLEAVRLPDDLAEQCLNLARDLGLSFAGIDLKLGDEGEAYCFEVNPSPAYSYYETQTGQPISAALARHLAAGYAG